MEGKSLLTFVSNRLLGFRTWFRWSLRELLMVVVIVALATSLYLGMHRAPFAPSKFFEHLDYMTLLVTSLEELPGNMTPILPTGEVEMDFNAEHQYSESGAQYAWSDWVDGPIAGVDAARVASAIRGHITKDLADADCNMIEQDGGSESFLARYSFSGGYGVVRLEVLTIRDPGTNEDLFYVDLVVLETPARPLHVVE